MSRRKKQFQLGEREETAMEFRVAISYGECEAAWVERCRSGDRSAFRSLYDYYKDRIYSLALYTLNGDTAAAEDVTQEVFVRVFQRIGQFRGDAEFSTWLYRMATNACIDELRLRKRTADRLLLHEPADDSCEFSRVDLTTDLRTALAALTPEQRAAVMLRYFDEMSYDDMSRIMRCSKGTVASRLSRALRTLARLLDLRSTTDAEDDRP